MHFRFDNTCLRNIDATLQHLILVLPPSIRVLYFFQIDAPFQTIQIRYTTVKHQKVNADFYMNSILKLLARQSSRPEMPENSIHQIQSRSLSLNEV